MTLNTSCQKAFSYYGALTWNFIPHIDANYMAFSNFLCPDAFELEKWTTIKLNLN